jgi:CRISPR/Cas system-associated endonuclease Cas1
VVFLAWQAGQAGGISGSIHSTRRGPSDAGNVELFHSNRVGAIIAMGLDPCFGFLHDGRKPGRLSLVWDCIEPLRPRLVKAVFGYVATHEFERRDFVVLVHKITLERTVRLALALAKEIVEVAVKAVSVSECVKTVRWLVKLL